MRSRAAAQRTGCIPDDATNDQSAYLVEVAGGEAIHRKIERNYLIDFTWVSPSALVTDGHEEFQRDNSDFAHTGHMCLQRLQSLSSRAVRCERRDLYIYMAPSYTEGAHAADADDLGN